MNLGIIGHHKGWVYRGHISHFHSAQAQVTLPPTIMEADRRILEDYFPFRQPLCPLPRVLDKGYFVQLQICPRATCRGPERLGQRQVPDRIRQLGRSHRKRRSYDSKPVHVHGGKRGALSWSMGKNALYFEDLLLRT